MEEKHSLWLQYCVQAEAGRQYHQVLTRGHRCSLQELHRVGREKGEGCISHPLHHQPLPELLCTCTHAERCLTAIAASLPSLSLVPTRHVNGARVLRFSCGSRSPRASSGLAPCFTCATSSSQLLDCMAGSEVRGQIGLHVGARYFECLFTTLYVPKVNVSAFRLVHKCLRRSKGPVGRGV